MEITVRYLDNHKFIASTGNHQIIIDQPKDKGGADEGMNPLEVFLASLGACIGFYAKNYCKNANIDTAGLQVKVNSQLSQDSPKSFKEIQVKIELSKDIGNRKDALLSFVKNCPVHNTLNSSPKVDLSI